MVKEAVSAELTRLSFSQLKTFRKCPEQWRIIRHEKLLPDLPSVASIAGRAFHEAYEHWELEERRDNSAAVAEFYCTRFRKELKRLYAIYPDPRQWIFRGKRNLETDVDIRLTDGRRQISAFIERCLADNNWMPYQLPDGSPAVELRFSVELGGIEVSGSVDLVKQYRDGQVTVEDLKTGKQEASAIQLGIYRHAINQLFSAGVDWGDFYYAKTGTNSSMFDLRRFTPSYLGCQFKGMVDAVKSGIILPSPGSDCWNCPARQMCREIG